MAAEYTCGHCWRTMGDAEGGFGSYDRVPLCHPDDTSERPDCYRKVTVYGHQLLNCAHCKLNLPGPGDDQMEQMWELGIDKFLDSLEFDPSEPEDHTGHGHDH